MRLVLQRMLGAENFAQRPRRGQRHHDGRDHGGTRQAETEQELAGGFAKVRRDRLGDLLHGVERAGLHGFSQRRRRRNQHRGHDDLRHRRAECGVHTRGRQVVERQAFFHDRRLLVKYHPGHDHRADIGGDQVQVFWLLPGDIGGSRRHGGKVGMGPPGDEQKHHLKCADGDRYAFDEEI